MSRNKLTIRSATKSDYRGIATLLDATFGSVDFEKRLKLWAWRHKSNPAACDNIPAFIIAEQDSKIVGVHGLVPIRMQVGDNQITAACSCDYAADPDYRSAGMKVKLHTMSKQISSLQISTSANMAAHRITLALGGKELQAGKKKLIKVLKVNQLLYHKLNQKTGNTPAKLISMILGKPADWAFVISRKLAKKPQNQNLQLAPISNFGDKIDSFCEKLSKQYSIYLIRDSRYFNWRYKDFPFKGIISIGLFEGEDIVGFLAVHNSVDENNLAFTAILELIYDTNKEYAPDMLLQEAVRLAERSDSHYITAVTPSLEQEILYTSHGFRIRKSDYSPFTYKNNSDHPDDYFTVEDNWYFSQGDGDICYYFD